MEATMKLGSQALFAKRLATLAQVAYGLKMLVFSIAMIALRLVKGHVVLELSLLGAVLLTSISSLVVDVVSDWWYKNHPEESVRQAELRVKIGLTGAAHITVSLIVVPIAFWSVFGWVWALVFFVPLGIAALLQVTPKLWATTKDGRPNQTYMSRLSYGQQIWIIAGISALILSCVV